MRNVPHGTSGHFFTISFLIIQLIYRFKHLKKALLALPRLKYCLLQTILSCKFPKGRGESTICKFCDWIVSQNCTKFESTIQQTNCMEMVSTELNAIRSPNYILKSHLHAVECKFKRYYRCPRHTS